MNKIDSGYKSKSGNSLLYTISDDGFDIFDGSTAKYPLFSQHEPYIPNHSLSYEENAKNFCMVNSIDYNNIPSEPADNCLPSYGYVRKIRADIDYLLLLSE